MTSISSPLLEHPEATAAAPATPRISVGMELALFQARGALLDGWQLTPEEAFAFVGGLHDAPACDRGLISAPDEDEAGETALFFAD